MYSILYRLFIDKLSWTLQCYLIFWTRHHFPLSFVSFVFLCKETLPKVSRWFLIGLSSFQIRSVCPSVLVILPSHTVLPWKSFVLSYVISTYPVTLVRHVLITILTFLFVLRCDSSQNLEMGLLSFLLIL